jgi:hypothetical protein
MEPFSHPYSQLILTISTISKDVMIFYMKGSVFYTEFCIQLLHLIISSFVYSVFFHCISLFT